MANDTKPINSYNNDTKPSELLYNDGLKPTGNTGQTWSSIQNIWENALYAWNSIAGNSIYTNDNK
jgi:cytosine/uracil/thiamine/allantoin permease